MTNTTLAARLGLFLWVVMVLLIGREIAFEPTHRTVVDSYLLGANRWLDGISLYSGSHGFIYMPAFAVLFTPFTVLPDVVVALLWRICLVLTYFYALSQLVKILIKQSDQYWQWFGLVSLIALPIAFSGLRNGQMNVLLSAVMVIATAWLIQERWTASSVLLALIMSLKPTFAVYFLLAVALYKPLWWRVPPVLLAFLSIPLLVGGIDYGIQQYINFYHMGQEAMTLGIEEPNWATFFNIMPQLFNVYVPESVQLLIKLPLALLTFWYCYRCKRFSDPITTGMVMLTLACCYHMLFNPRSVNTDYVILGSVLAFWFAAANGLWHDRVLALLVGLNALMVLEAYELSKLITPEHHSWINPVATLLFTGLVFWQLNTGKRFKTPLQS
ncbi:hypothetical protein ACH42_06665 [Endozoicomonas sp. (ex Bugula neritina AB1)]|nr:hypothetical protein ACH42_06665 [Endozoicomonas sp. (ex Bugula neritina AB1)]